MICYTIFASQIPLFDKEIPMWTVTFVVLALCALILGAAISPRLSRGMKVVASDAVAVVNGYSVFPSEWPAFRRGDVILLRNGARAKVKVACRNSYGVRRLGRATGTLFERVPRYFECPASEIGARA